MTHQGYCTCGAVLSSANHTAEQCRERQTTRSMTDQTPSVQQALHALICAYDAAPIPQITALIAAVRAEGAAQIEPHDCEAWAMEGIGCANCNPASPQAWQARAEAAEAKLVEAGHRSLEQGERLIEWRNRAERAEAENQRLRAQLAKAQP